MLTKTVTLKVGLKIAGKTYKNLVIREANAGDLFDAEDMAPVHKRHQYNAAVLSLTLVSADDFTGPFTMGMFRPLKSVDLNKLEAAMYELDAESGEEISADET